MICGYPGTSGDYPGTENFTFAFFEKKKAFKARWRARHGSRSISTCLKMFLKSSLITWSTEFVLKTSQKKQKKIQDHKSALPRSQWNFTVECVYPRKVNAQWSFIRRASSTKPKSWTKKAFQFFEKSILMQVLDKDSFCSLQLVHIVYASRKKLFIPVTQIGPFLWQTLVSQIHSVGN